MGTNREVLDTQEDQNVKRVAEFAVGKDGGGDISKQLGMTGGYLENSTTGFPPLYLAAKQMPYDCLICCNHKHLDETTAEHAFNLEDREAFLSLA